MDFIRTSTCALIGFASLIVNGCGSGNGGDSPRSGSELPLVPDYPPTSPSTVVFATLLDASGKTFREIGLRSEQAAGVDGLFFTEDDNIAGYTEYRFAEQPPRRYHVSVNAAGADGAWFTADDEASVLLDIEFLDADGNMIATIPSGTPGSDGIWLTGDDRILGYDAPGRDPRVFATYGSPGPDGLWFTADDSIERFTSIERDASGRPLQEWYGGAGADRLPLTADDTACGLSRYRYLDGGVSIEDGVNYNTGCLHNDSGQASRWQFTRDVQGRMVRRVVYLNAGADGVWLTDDDGIDNYEAYTYDAAGLRDQTGYFASGADEVWFSDDDTIGTIIIERDNFLGHGERSRVRYRPGADGSWRTADDEVIEYATVTTALQPDGTTVETSIAYQRSGEDGVWFTADDLALSTTVKVTKRLSE
jgi:hypothetical protein